MSRNTTAMKKEAEQPLYSAEIIQYQKRVDCVIDWIRKKEKNLTSNKDSIQESIQDLKIDEILEIYHKHEKDMIELARYNKIINDFKAEAQRILKNIKKFTEEERDEVGIQTDALMVGYERLKYLSIDRCHTLQKAIERKQQLQLDTFEQWLTSVEEEIKELDKPIGVDHHTVSEQFRQILDLEQQLERQNEHLEYLSDMILVFDEIDLDTMKRTKKSCDDLDLQLTDINDRWTAVCGYVDQRHGDLQKAAAIICSLTDKEQSKQDDCLARIERRLSDLEMAVNDSQPDSDSELHFVTQLTDRYRKIDQEIKSRFCFFTDLSANLHSEINQQASKKQFELLVAHFETKLSRWQSRWSTILDRQRMLKHALDALVKSCTDPNDEVYGDDCDRDEACRREYVSIPLPEPITTNFDTFSFLSDSSSKPDLKKQEPFDELNENSHSLLRLNDRKNDIDNESEDQLEIENVDESEIKNDIEQSLSNIFQAEARDQSAQSTNSLQSSSGVGEPPRAIAYQSKKSPVSNGKFTQQSTTKRFDDDFAQHDHIFLGLNKTKCRENVQRHKSKTKKEVRNFSSSFTAKKYNKLEDSKSLEVSRSPGKFSPAKIRSNDGQPFSINPNSGSIHNYCSNEDDGENSYKSDSEFSDLERKLQEHRRHGDAKDSIGKDENDDEDKHVANRLENCRVEEWKHALESFSLWLKQVETSLGVEPDIGVEDRVVPTWSRLSLQDRLTLLDEIEQQVITTCRDEFDRLLAQGQQIIIGLPDIYDNDVMNMKSILNDIDERWTSVKECLIKRRKEILRTDRWHQLLLTLQDLCKWVSMKKDSELIPECKIGGDLIALAQQKDYLLQLKKEIAAKDCVESSRNEARLFFDIFHCLQRQANQLNRSNTNDIDTNNGEELDLVALRNEIERADNRLSEYLNELMQHIGQRITRIDKVHKQMHTLQQYMQQFANRLQEIELYRCEWPPVMTLDLRDLSEQLEQLKLFRDRLCDLECLHKQLNEVYEQISNNQVSLNDTNLNRLQELNSIWQQLICDVDERQKSIEEAFESLDATEQEFLQITVDQPWERRVAASKVPYFIDHLNGCICWDHPRFTELMVGLNNYNDIIFSAYRTAIKLRVIQGRLGLSCIMLETLNGTFKQQGLRNHRDDSSFINVTQMLECLKMIFAHAQRANPNLDVALCIDLCLSWILSLFDTTRVGSIRTQAFETGLVILCCATREEKYTYMFNMVADDDGHANDKKLCSLFSDCLQIPRLLAETDAFTGADSIEASIQSCLHEANLIGARITLSDFLNWLTTEPQFIIWLPVLHRILVAQTMKHKLRCKICRNQPMLGLRYKCLMCFNYNICQNCFLYGRHLVHHKKCDHPMQEYCSTTTSGENVRDLTKILRNKLKNRHQNSRTPIMTDNGTDDEMTSNSPCLQ